MDYLLIGAGAFIGANLRYFVALWAAARFGTAFPYGTLAINVTGSFVIGLFLAALGERAASATGLRLFFATGMLGGYTTFSTFSYETLTLVQQQNWAGAALYAGGSVALGLAAAAAGVTLGRLFS